MWGLFHEDGTILKNDCPTQWEAVRNAKREDGSSFKKTEALQLSSGTTVYRERYETFMSEDPHINDDGTFGKVYARKVSHPILTKFTLRELPNSLSLKMYLQKSQKTVPTKLFERKAPSGKKKKSRSQ